MQRIAVAVLVAASGVSAGCSGASSSTPPGGSAPLLRDPAIAAYDRVARRYESRVAACRELPRLDRRACRDRADARFTMASDELEALQRADQPVIRFARAP